MELVVLTPSLPFLTFLHHPKFLALSLSLSLSLIFIFIFFTSSSSLLLYFFFAKMDAKGMQKNMAKVVKKEADVIGSDDEYEHHQFRSLEDDDSKKKKVVVIGGGSGKKVSSGGGGMRCCQAEKCTADLSDAKQYYRRHKVCEHHSKAQVVLVAGIRQRFCQQCSRFHELSEFDETKRSCRRRLAGHNERRRKNSAESNGEGSSRKGTGTQLKDIVCGQVDDRGKITITIQEKATYKHFQIR